MLATFMSLVLVNTYSWFGGQGYCAYDFALHETEDYESVEVVLRPVFNPEDTASGKTDLPDETISLDHIGGARANSAMTAKIETDCSVTGFTIVRASARSEGKEVDLIKKGLIEFDVYHPLSLSVGAND